jgi:phosphate transport system protein
MKSDSDAIECAVELLKVEHNIERTADRCTNIAERVIFIATSYVPELNP